MIKFAKRGNAPEEVITDLGEMFEKLYYDEGGRFIIENEYDANILNYVCMFNHYDDFIPGYFDKPGTYKSIITKKIAVGSLKRRHEK